MNRSTATCTFLRSRLGPIDLIPNSRGAFLEILGVASFGQSPLRDSSRTEDHLQLAESVTLARGARQFGFGTSVQRITLDTRLANRFAGVFVRRQGQRQDDRRTESSERFERSGGAE